MACTWPPATVNTAKALLFGAGVPSPGDVPAELSAPPREVMQADCVVNAAQLATDSPTFEPSGTGVTPSDPTKFDTTIREVWDAPSARMLDGVAATEPLPRASNCTLTVATAVLLICAPCGVTASICT